MYVRDKLTARHIDGQLCASKSIYLVVNSSTPSLVPPLILWISRGFETYTWNGHNIVGTGRLWAAA